MIDIKQKLEELERTVKDEVQKAYELGFNEGLGIKLPTQKEFNNDHKEVMPYGEEGEWLVLSHEYTEEEAYELFKKYLETDMDEEWMEGVLDTVRVGEVGYKRPKSEPEPVYWINPKEGGFFQAWIVETGY